PMMMGYRPRVSQSFSAVSEATLSDDAIDSVISWFAGNGRDLPWRHDVPPWAILAFEVMLQQTLVVRVLPRWTERMRRWPTPAGPAAARTAELLRLRDRLG